ACALGSTRAAGRPPARPPRRPAAAPGEWPLFPSPGGYRAPFVAGDLVAGLTLAAIAIPEQMATARLGGFPPQAGLMVLVAAALAFAAFGGSRFVSCGADSTITPIFPGGLPTTAARGPAPAFAPSPPPRV